MEFQPNTLPLSPCPPTPRPSPPFFSFVLFFFLFLLLLLLLLLVLLCAPFYSISIRPTGIIAADHHGSFLSDLPSREFLRIEFLRIDFETVICRINAASLSSIPALSRSVVQPKLAWTGNHVGCPRPKSARALNEILVCPFTEPKAGTRLREKMRMTASLVCTALEEPDEYVVPPSSGGLPTMALGFKIIDHRLTMVTGKAKLVLRVHYSPIPIPWWKKRKMQAW